MKGNGNEKRIRDLVKEYYKIFLEREADEEGLEHYVSMIKEGKIRLEELENEFKKSPEYNWLKTRWEPLRNIKDDLSRILSQSIEYEEYLDQKDRKNEPESIFVSAYNEETEQGGIFIIKDHQLKVLFEGNMCSGLYYDKKNNVLLGVIKKEPQIIAFKIHNNEKMEQIPVNFSKYIFAQDSHDMLIVNDRLYIVASNGETNSKIASNAMEHWVGKGNQHVGKIIVSDISIRENKIEIKNSRVYNPFECEHHHHINDICKFKGKIYLSSHSFCNKEKNLVKKGALSTLDENLHAHVILDVFEQPHSLYDNKNKLYLCSSATATVFSIDPKKNTIKLEYKGVNTYTRGLLVTDRYFYIGLSFSLGRTNSKFTNPNFGILQFNRDTGETTRIKLPTNCDNVYKIISS